MAAATIGDAADGSPVSRREWSRVDSWILAALTAFAALVRTVVAARGGVWRDEGLFLYVSQLPSWSAVVEFLRRHESHPPLFYAMMRGWIAAFGPGDLTARALPLLFGIALVPAVYVVGERLFSHRVARIAALFAALSPPLIDHASAVRPYSLMPLLVLGAAYALVVGIRRGGAGPWAAHAVATIALVYTHNWSWLAVAGGWVACVVVIAWYAPRPRGTIVRDWLGAQVAVALAFLPWAPTLARQVGHAGHAGNSTLR